MLWPRICPARIPRAYTRRTNQPDLFRARAIDDEFAKERACSHRQYASRTDQTSRSIRRRQELYIHEGYDLRGPSAALAVAMQVAHTGQGRCAVALRPSRTGMKNFLAVLATERAERQVKEKFILPPALKNAPQREISELYLNESSPCHKLLTV